MPGKPLRLIVTAIGVGALIGVAWIFVHRGDRAPTGMASGWPVSMSTVAGDGARGFVDGAASTARFSDPFAVAIDEAGSLYVADAGQTNRIRKIERDGRTTTLPGHFDTPSGVAVDRKGNVYVADTGSNRIFKIGRDGEVATIAGDGLAGHRDGPAMQAQFNGPIGLAVGRKGEVYVADTYNDRIRLITREGRVKTLAGGARPGFADGHGASAAFHTPCGLALAPDGALLIADSGNDAVRRLDDAGFVTTVARQAVLREPIGLAATDDGYVYVASYRRGRIVEVSPLGELRIVTGRDASVLDNRRLQLARPAGLAIDKRGALYVAETARYAIRKLTPRHPRNGPPPPAPDLTPTSPSLLKAAAVPWPLAPQGGWHEVVGGMGEVRGREGARTLHGGLDVRADVGIMVLSMADGKVASPLSAWGVGDPSESLQLDELTYIHVRVGRTPGGAPLDAARFQLLRDPAGKLSSVRVKRGTRFRTGDPIGTVNPMAHVHLELGARGGDANPVALRLAGLADSISPRIVGVQLLDASGNRLKERQAGRLLVKRHAGALSLVADAWDQVDGNAGHRRLGLYRLGYQILAADGSPMAGFEQPLITIEFDRLPMDRAADTVYAPGSGVTAHGAAETRFLYIVSNRLRAGRAEAVGWRPADLPPGDYTLRVYAADYAGNVAVDGRDLPIRVL